MVLKVYPDPPIEYLRIFLKKNKLSSLLLKILFKKLDIYEITKIEFVNEDFCCCSEFKQELKFDRESIAFILEKLNSKNSLLINLLIRVIKNR